MDAVPAETGICATAGMQYTTRFIREQIQLAAAANPGNRHACVILPTIDPKRCFILSYDLRAKKIDGLIEQFGTHGKKRKRVAVLDDLLAEVNPAA